MSMGCGKCGQQWSVEQYFSGRRTCQTPSAVVIFPGSLLICLVAILAVGVWSSCLGARPVERDLPRCGDGIVQAPEVCDDGDSLNATAASHCTLVCGSDELKPYLDFRWLRLPTAPKWIETTSSSGPNCLVFTSFDDSGIQIIRNFDAKLQRQLPDTVIATETLFVQSAPSDVQFGGDGIVWIEKYTEATGGPRMYTVALPFNPLDIAPLVPRELEYPFRHGEGGHLIDLFSPGGFIFDRDRDPPFNMLSIHARWFNSDFYYTNFVNHGPSPGRVQTLVYANWGFPSRPEAVQLRFFAGPQSMVTHSPIVPYGIDAQVISPSPFAPVAAIGGRFHRLPHFPWEIALLDVSGAVTLHTFFCNEPAPNVDDVDDVFARLQPGTTSIRAQYPGRGDSAMLLTINAAGQLLLIGNSGNGHGLKPQVVFNGPPCISCVLSQNENMILAFDNVIAVGSLTPKYLDSPGISHFYDVDPCRRD